MDKKDKIRVFGLLLLLAMLISGCVNKNTIIGYRKHDSKYDVIKFADIEWFEEKEAVEKKLMSSVITSKDLVFKNYDVTSVNANNTEPKLYMTIISGENDPIGKLAGWDIPDITIHYVSDGKNDAKQYVYQYRIVVKDEEKGSYDIYDDLMKKLDAKYGKSKPVDESISKGYDRWSDENENTVTMQLLNASAVQIYYHCHDVIDLVNEYRKTKLLEDSKGL